MKQENKQLKRLSLDPLALPKEVPPKEEPDPVQHDREQLQGELGLWWGQQQDNGTETAQKRRIESAAPTLPPPPSCPPTDAVLVCLSVPGGLGDGPLGGGTPQGMPCSSQPHRVEVTL